MKVEDHKKFVIFAEALNTIEYNISASKSYYQNHPFRLAMLEFLQEKVMEFEKFADSECEELKAQFELRQKLYNTFIRLVNIGI